LWGLRKVVDPELALCVDRLRVDKWKTWPHTPNSHTGGPFEDVHPEIFWDLRFGRGALLVKSGNVRLPIEGFEVIYCPSARLEKERIGEHSVI